MKYTAHLATGGKLELQLDSEPDLFDTTWLVDDHGVMVNMAHVAALVPESTGKIKYLIDGEGDRWYQARDGDWVQSNVPTEYECGSWSRQHVEDKWGPLKEVR